MPDTYRADAAAALDTYREELRRTLARHGVRGADADDLLGELAARQLAATPAPVADWRARLHLSLRRLASTRYRDSRRRGTVLSLDTPEEADGTPLSDHLADDAPTAERRSASAALWQTVAATVARLPGPDRDLLHHLADAAANGEPHHLPGSRTRDARRRLLAALPADVRATLAD